MDHPLLLLSLSRDEGSEVEETADKVEAGKAEENSGDRHRDGGPRFHFEFLGKQILFSFCSCPFRYQFCLSFSFSFFTSQDTWRRMDQKAHQVR